MKYNENLLNDFLNNLGKWAFNFGNELWVKIQQIILEDPIKFVNDVINLLKNLRDLIPIKS